IPAPRRSTPLVLWTSRLFRCPFPAPFAPARTGGLRTGRSSLAEVPPGQAKGNRTRREAWLTSVVVVRRRRSGTLRFDGRADEENLESGRRRDPTRLGQGRLPRRRLDGQGPRAHRRRRDLGAARLTSHDRLERHAGEWDDARNDRGGEIERDVEHH